MSKEQLQQFRDKIQGMCYWWPRSFKHGYCKEANGMDHVCCFCELAEEFDKLMQN